MQGIPSTCKGYETAEQAARTVARDRFAWPGGYALGVITTDGGWICGACVAEELEQILESTRDGADDGWAVEAAFYADADDAGGYDDDGGPEPVLCDHCGRPISDGTTRKG